MNHPRSELQSPPHGTSAQALWPVAQFVLLALVLLGLSRLGLVAWQSERVGATDGLAFILLQGLRFDLVALGVLLVAPSLLLTPLLAFPGTLRLATLLQRSWLSLALTALFATELATPSFLTEYDTRPNYLFVEYLEYPREVLATLWGAYPLQLSLSVVLVPLVLLGSYRLLRRATRLETPLHPIEAAALTLLLPALCFAAARSTLAHRPVNPSTVCFSGDAMVNTLPLNSLYSVAYAIYELKQNEAPDELAYGEMSYAEVLEVVRTDAGLSPEDCPDPSIPTLHEHHPTTERERPLNLVIVLEESLGAEFVGALGGLPLTPNLDAMLDQGLCLDRLYATGTRSVRGIEAVVTGFLPTPVRSVVKLPGAQRGFFTVAELLKREGYATSFLYGGEGHFDNMARFFTGNGFERVVDCKDYDDPMFVGSWGVSDQDLFRRAHAEFEAMDDEPFFSLVFTSSNHSPWDFPSGQVEPYEQPAATRNNAVQYADHALGEFFELARASDYWEDTLFLVVADHNSRVFGASLVPVERFHVPAVFLGGTVEPGHIDTLASQVDLVPTALSLMGLAASSPTLGRDLTDPSRAGEPGRAILQYDRSNLFLTDEAAVLLRLDAEPQTMSWDGHELLPVAHDPALERRSLAHALWPQLSYRSGDYRLPPL
ncbi:MAG: LTA synthase family protein [Planctomycetota bacterium]|nr:LTA synthase family protein [Planctomycetota bacterium]